MMELKDCACGCGELINSFNKNGELFFKSGHARKNRKFPEENRNQHSSQNNNWKGGKHLNAKGYVLIRKEGHPRASKRGNYVREHIILIEQNIGRYLKDDEIVHHINGNKSDNRLENLMLMKHGKHSSLHRKKELKQGVVLFGKK